MGKEKKVRSKRGDKKKDKTKGRSLLENNSIVPLDEDDFEKGAEIKVYDDDQDVESDVEMDEGEKKEQRAFFGLIDRTELEYFKTAESTLAVDGFGSAEERQGFISGVFREAQGKELKLVTEQICSKLMERLILMASVKQLKRIFKSFSGHFLQLSKHKYSSHCVETLLVRCAATVEKEMLNPEGNKEEDTSMFFVDTGDNEAEQPVVDDDEDDDGEPWVSMETLFLGMVEELKPHLLSLPDHAYGSHVLRLLLLILSGSSLPSTTAKATNLRSKKSKIARKMISIKDNSEFEKAYQIPSSFEDSLKEVLEAFAEALDTTKAREMAIHKVSSPVLQLLVQVEYTTTSEKKKKKLQLKFANLLFETESKEKDRSEESFVEYLLSDPIGSHFIEAIIPWLPLKVVERLYTLYMKDRIAKLARRDNGNFVIQALLKKLRPVEVKEILDALIPQFEEYIGDNVVLCRAMIDASGAQQSYRIDEITDAVLKLYGMEEDKSQFLEKLLELKSSTLGNTKGDWPTAEEMHRSLFLQSVMKASPKFLGYTIEGFLSMEKDRLLLIAKHSVFSHVLDSCLVPQVDIVLRRRMLNHLSGLFAELSCNAYGSHIVDRCWKFTYKLKHFRERIANELVAETEMVKKSMYGRVVWRNWSLDKYITKKFEWWKVVKAAEDSIAESLGEQPKSQQPQRMPAAPEKRPKDRKPYDRPSRRN
ncbi:nucleolar protein 9 [Trichomonascus vanleenenianus]|uniref:RNA-binding RNA processing protein NOP9 n=1 Tax=Trichomonascus vanleenenianus TaxID=2268995 RepID=UPI003EC9536A